MRRTSRTWAPPWWSPPHAFVGAVVLAGLLAFAVTMLAYPGWVFPEWADPRLAVGQLFLAAVLAFVAFRWPVLVRLRTEVITHVWGEAVTLVAIALVAHPVGVVAVVVGSTLAAVVRRLETVKVIFAGGQSLLACSIAWLAFHAMPGSAPNAAIGPTILALLVAGIAFIVPNELCSLVVVALAQRVSVPAVFWRSGGRDQLALLANLAVGVALAALTAVEIWLVVLLPITIGLMRWIHHSSVRLREHEDAFRQLEEISHALNRLDQDEVLSALVNGAARLFRAEYVEVVLADGKRVVAAVGDAGSAGPTEGLAEGLAAGSAVGPALESGRASGSAPALAPSAPDAVVPAESVVVERVDSVADPSLPLADDDDVRTGSVALPAIVHAPLRAAGEQLGEIRLRYASKVSRLTRAEERTFSTLAAIAGVSIANARQHERIRHDAVHDPLTDLPNRRALLAAMATALVSDPDSVGLLLVDLNRFKEVNDTLGHAAGDRLLREVSGRMVAAVGELGRVHRLGGDEFAVLARTARLDELTTIADRIEDRLAAPVRLPTVDPTNAPVMGPESGDSGLVGSEFAGSEFAGSESGGGRRYGDDIRREQVSAVTVTVAGSVGVATASVGVDANELLRRADVAMYRAKAAGGGVDSYDPQADSSSLQQLLLEPELRHALADSDQILVQFQPQLELSGGAPVGAEALVRWRHPVYGVLSADVVVPAVTRAGLDTQLTVTVLDRALAARKTWLADHGVDVPVAVNLSPRAVLDPTLPERVATLLKRHRTEPDRLVVELPETVATADLDAVERVLIRLHRLGVRISLDDFGTGGAPLTMLARLPVDEVKIDRSFVRELIRSGTSEAIVRATVELAHSLRLRAVGVGVGSVSLDRVLREVGCDVAQGNYYAAPMDSDAVGERLAAAAREAASGPGGASVVRLSSVRRRPS